MCRYPTAGKVKGGAVLLRQSATLYIYCEAVENKAERSTNAAVTILHLGQKNTDNRNWFVCCKIDGADHLRTSKFRKQITGQTRIEKPTPSCCNKIAQWLKIDCRGT